MAKEVWTVLFDIKSVGNMAPAVGWAEKKLKVGAVSGGATKEKNEPATRATGIKTADVQEAKIVSVIAESAEEACLVVKKFYGSGAAGATPTDLETVGSQTTSQFVNGKMAGVVTGNLTEVAVI